MNELPIPQNYEEWKHCITVSCGIPLTLDFVQERAASLANPKDYRTIRFVETWGDRHLAAVRGWFEQAKSELETAAQ